jgi:methionyl-tRNA formyltransferase
MTLRVVFMGTPDFAVPTLEAVAARHRVVAAYTRPPAPAGRGLGQKPSPVQAAAERLGVPVLTPTSLKGEAAAETMRGHGADVAVVVAYGLLLPQGVLDAPRLGCLNLHASLLPRWRGAAPIQRAVMAGDAETGVAVMRMEAGLDTGPVAREARVPIGPDDTAGLLHDRLMVVGAALMAEALDALEAGELAFVPQAESGVEYARKITNAECRLDLAEPARALHDRVRALSPFPGAYLELDLGRGPERVKVLEARAVAGEAGTPGATAPGTLLADGALACGEGALKLVRVQRAGRGPVAMEEFLRGARLDPGARLLGAAP